MLMPYFELTIQGVSAPKELYTYVKSLQVKNTCHGANLCTLVLYDPDLIFVQGSYIVEQSLVKVKYGYNDSGTLHTRQFEGFVSLIDADFPQDGMPLVTVHCMDKSHIMNREEKTRTWEKQKISTVVEKIFRGYGFKVKIDDTGKTLDNIQQSNETDISFILKLADEVGGYVTYIEGETAYFVKRVGGSPVHNLVYRDTPYNLHSFRPRINKESKKLTLPVKDIDHKTLSITTTMKPSTSLTGLGNTKVNVSSSRK